MRPSPVVSCTVLNRPVVSGPPLLCVVLCSQSAISTVGAGLPARPLITTRVVNAGVEGKGGNDGLPKESSKGVSYILTCISTTTWV